MIETIREKFALLLLVVLISIFSIGRAYPFFWEEEYEERPTRLLEQLIYERVNEERARYHLPALKWTSDVAGVARRHSQDMAVKGYFAHKNKEGEMISERLENAGIVFTIASENIFKCVNYPDIVEESVLGWMESSGHRENILNDTVVETGVGVYKANKGNEYYITQNFIKRALKFIPAPSKLSQKEVDKIFDIVRRTIERTKYNYRETPLKNRILKELISFGIPVEKDLYIQGFLKESVELKLKADFVVKGGLIINFTNRELEADKDLFSRLINPQSYSAVILINETGEKIQYLLMRGEES